MRSFLFASLGNGGHRRGQAPLGGRRGSRGHRARPFRGYPPAFGYTRSSALMMLYICVGVTGAGFYLLLYGDGGDLPITASLVFFFKPALAPVLALVFLQEAIPVSMVVGVLFILAGSLVSLIPALSMIPAMALSERYGAGSRAGPDAFPADGQRRFPSSRKKSPDKNRPGFFVEGCRLVPGLLAASLQIFVDGILAAHEVRHFRPHLFNGDFFHCSSSSRAETLSPPATSSRLEASACSTWNSRDFSCAYLPASIRI